MLAFVEIDLAMAAAMASVSARATVLPRRESGIEEGNARHPYCRAIDAKICAGRGRRAKEKVLKIRER